MSPMRGRRFATLVIWLLCGSSACTTDQPIVSTTPASNTTTTSTTSPRPSVPPPITRPLDASAYRAKPCELITAKQAAEFGLEQASPHDEPESADCIYPGTPNSRSPFVRVRYFYGTDWLGEIYEGRADRWHRDDFIPITIAGQPAVREEDPLKFDQPRNEEQCHAAVGLANTQGLDVVAVTATSSCDQAVAIAEVIVRNLNG